MALQINTFDLILEAKKILSSTRMHVQFNMHEVRTFLTSPYKAAILLNELNTLSYTHEPPNQVVGVGVIFFGGELRGVELSGPQDLQHTVQSLSHRNRTALLSCVDDVYYLGKRKKEMKKKSPFSVTKQTQHTNKRHKELSAKTCRNRVLLSLCVCHGNVHVTLGKCRLG